MADRREPEHPWFRGESRHPLTRAMQWLLVLFFFPGLAFVSWQKAWQFDPYTMSFFTKTYVEPSPEMPGELRIVGWIMIGIGLLVAYAGVKGMVRRIGAWIDSLMLLWIGVMVGLFGGSFFIAANAAQERIEQETAGETRQT